MLLTCGTILELENMTRTEPVWDFSRDAWLERLHGFPGLSFVLGTAIRQWRQNALELLVRLRHDLPLIEEELFGGAKTGPLVAIDPDLGDRHNDGRSVAVLLFASGRRAVYKPKNQSGALCFTSLVELLNRAGPSLQLPAQRILDRGDYSWEEFVEQREATTEPEASRFFQRFGMVLRLLQLVEGRDFWIDNLRVAGDVPVFVDLECIMQPRIDGDGFQVSLPDLDPQLYEESVLPTGAVTQPINVSGIGRQDFGALAPPGPRALPLGMWSGYHDRDNGNIWLRGGRLFWEPDAAWPRLQDKPANPEDHLDELETGYREMQALLCGSAEEIASPQGPLRGIEEAPVRVLMRSTWEYLVLLRASLEPSSLLSGNARELVLANVPASTHKWGDAAAVSRRARIARCELDALRVLDVPLFHGLAREEALRAPGGEMIEGLFAGRALDRLRGRLESVASFELLAHLEILKLAVCSMSEHTRGIEDASVVDRAR
jgi:lantibiotic modifying enzyme